MSSSDVTTLGGLLTKGQAATLDVLTKGAITLRGKLTGAFDEQNRPKPEAKGTLADVAIRAKKAATMAADIAKNAMEPHLLQVDVIKAAIRPLVEAFKGLENDAKAAAALIIEAEAEERRAAVARAEAEMAEAKRRQAEAQKASLAAAATGDLDDARTHEVNAAEAWADGREARAAMPTGPAPNMVTGTSGSLFGRQDWGWDVENLADVPDEYTVRVVNEDAVRAAIKAGVRKIPGLKLYDRTTIVTKPAGRAKVKK